MAVNLSQMKTNLSSFLAFLLTTICAFGDCVGIGSGAGFEMMMFRHFRQDMELTEGQDPPHAGRGADVGV